MKRIIFFIVVALGFALAGKAAPVSVTQANQLYTKGQYAEAAKEYERIAETEGTSPELYYNLGNAYYKMNEIGKSILNYERALRLNPLFDDARFNLELAQQKVVDNIYQTPTFFLKRWVDSFIRMLSSNQWVYLGWGLFLLTLILGLMFIFGPSYFFRKISFYLASVFFVITLMAVLFSGIRKSQMLHHTEGIIMTGVVTAKSSPDQSGTNLFELHEGTKVTIKSNLGKWIEIELGNGNVGWIEQEDIENI